MSNFIPIVSSSPPPIDDSGGFDNWGDDDDDDFGTFTGADDSSMSTPGNTCMSAIEIRGSGVVKGERNRKLLRFKVKNFTNNEF